MYKLTIKNAGQYSGVELGFSYVAEAANFIRNLAEDFDERGEGGIEDAKLEFHIEPFKAEGADQ